MNYNPKTIGELRMIYEDLHLPPENVTRFFIGKDYRGAKAFGIYQDSATGKFIVYKNKADGTRVIRYEGINEEYAVNQLYTRLEEEIINQENHGNNPTGRNSRSTVRRPATRVASQTLSGIIIIVVACLMFIIFAIAEVTSSFGPSTGYYGYNGKCYYVQSNQWYVSEDFWEKATTVPTELKENYNSYYLSSSYRSTYFSEYGAGDFKNTIYYQAPSTSHSYRDDDDYYYSSSSSYDSYDSSWDSSWDSSSTDWDSDW